MSFAREEEVEEGFKECRQGPRDEDEEPDLHAFVRLAKLKFSIMLMIDERTWPAFYSAFWLWDDLSIMMSQ